MKRSTFFLCNFFVVAVLMVGSVTSCDDESDPVSNALQQLGDLKPQSVGFNVNGEPIIFLKPAVYVWSTANKQWTKVGSTLNESIFFNALFSDKAGDYFASDGCRLYKSIGGTGEWQPFDLSPLGNQQVCNMPYMVQNKNGDFLVRIQSPEVVYWKKNAMATTWSKLVPTTVEHENATPSTLTADGIAFFGQGDFVLNTNTNKWETLFDRTHPNNVNVVANGAYPFIGQNGEYYMMVYALDNDIHNLYKLNTANRPAAFEKAVTFNDPKIYSTGWSTRLTDFHILATGEIVGFFTSNRHPETTWSSFKGSVTNPSLQILDKGLTQRSLRVNLLGEAYVWTSNGYLYRWQ